MHLLPPTNPSRIGWLAVGILIGLILAQIGLLGSALIAAVAVVLAHRRGYRLTITKDHTPDDHRM